MATGLSITGLHPSGKAYGRFEGRRVFVNGAIPGETADVEITYGGQDFLTGEIKHLHTEHPARTRPVCRHAGTCGGCAWQHIRYDHQLELKQTLVAEALEHAGHHGLSVLPVIPSPSPLFYRNRLEYTFSATRWFYPGEGEVENPADRLALGFNVEGLAGRVEDILECYLQPPPTHAISRRAKELAAQAGIPFYNFRDGNGMLRNLEIRTTSAGQIWAAFGFTSEPTRREFAFMQEMTKICPEVNAWLWNVLKDARKALAAENYHFVAGEGETLTETVNGLTMIAGMGSFFQPNSPQAPGLFALIRNLAEIMPGETVYDLYCGVGAIALHLSAQAGKVVGIEGAPQAVAEARENARLNGSGNCTFVCGDVLETFTPDFAKAYGHPDVLILDPPRSGTLIEIKKHILALQPRRIIYVSCNPQSLARDLKMLLNGYTSVCLQPIDMFPQTPHVETIAVLDRR
jgi:23S rRNA (uracil1939-C5)-methyltransferase